MLGVVMHNCNPRLRQKDPKLEACLGIFARPCLKINKKILGSSLMVEYLSSMCKALVSIINTTKKKRRKVKRMVLGSV
jgi:hypothetical protein